MICPGDVRIFTYPDIPDYREERALLLYPGNNAKPLKNLCSAAADDDCPAAVQFDRVVFIDCTWKQAHGIYSDERLCYLPQAVINGRQTAFWRGQKGKSKEHLATIEVRSMRPRDF